MCYCIRFNLRGVKPPAVFADQQPSVNVCSCKNLDQSAFVRRLHHKKCKNCSDSLGQHDMQEHLSKQLITSIRQDSEETLNRRIKD